MSEELFTTPELGDITDEQMEESSEEIENLLENTPSGINPVSLGETAEILTYSLVEEQVIPKIDYYGSALIILLGIVIGVITAKIALRG